MPRRPCITCGEPSDGAYCDKHKPRRPPGSTTARGLGADHQRRRRELLPFAIGQPCPICHKTMYADQELDLHHTVPRSHDRSSVGDAIAHAECNRRLGNRVQVQPPQ